MLFPRASGLGGHATERHLARILIVEDDLLCRTIMTCALLQRGHDTKALPDGGRRRFDVLTMAQMLGTDAVED